MSNPSMLGRSAGPEPSAASEQDASFADILSQFEQSHAHKPEEGQGRDAVVVAVNQETVFLDFGYKTEGTIPVAELRDASGAVTVKPGDKLKVSIKGRDQEGYYQLSLIKVARPKDWSSFQKAFDEKIAIAGVVSGVVKGGLSVDVGVRAFMPASRSGVRDAADVEKLVGQEISCKIIKLDVDDEDVVVDRRAVLEEEEARAKEQRFGEIKEGVTVTGTVRSLTDYGAFVDIGGFDGLLHVADISWTRINKPADVLTVGQQVEVQVLKVDPNKRRIGLGMKQLKQHPWEAAGEKYTAGERVKGTVTRVADFGAFVELEPGVEGLIHFSEMSWSKKVRKPSDVVKAGDTVEVVVLGVNTADRRISLGLKQALGDPWAEIEKRYPAGAVVEAPVVSLQKFGAFVELEPGIEAMIHVGDISAEKRINHPQEVLKQGEKVKAKVLDVDKGKRRIRLGMKQLVPTSLDEYMGEHKEGDSVTGRVVDVKGGRARIELGEGVTGYCAVPEGGNSCAKDANNGAADLSALTSLLAARWKGGGAAAGKDEPLRAGQIRTFRISKLNAESKRIDLDIA